MANAQDITDLQATRSNLIAIVKAQTAAWITAGCPTTYSVDGESYDWNGWLASKTKAIDDLTTLINRLNGPWINYSRGRG